jgi:hypothetical protein
MGPGRRRDDRELGFAWINYIHVGWDETPKRLAGWVVK